MVLLLLSSSIELVGPSEFQPVPFATSLRAHTIDTFRERPVAAYFTFYKESAYSPVDCGEGSGLVPTFTGPAITLSLRCNHPCSTLTRMLYYTEFLLHGADECN